MDKSIRRCSRCILPANYPDISFDDRGICRMCREFDARFGGIDWEAREARLSSILDRYRGRGGRYDCIVPFSGGKDSTYALWLMRNRYGMNPLAFHVDNGFAHAGTVAAARKAARDLDVGFLSYSPSRNFLYRVYAHALEQTGDFCLACVVLVPTAAFRAAEMHGVRLVVGGFCEMTEAPPPEHAYVDRVCFWNVMKSRFSRRDLARDFMFPSWKRMFSVKYINLPDYWKWDLGLLNETLERELGARRTVEDFRQDCLATPVSDYIFRLKAGFGKYEYLCANLVRSGFLDREKAVALVEKRESGVSPEGVRSFLSLLGCGESALDGIKDKSIFQFGVRRRAVKRLAVKLRELLP